MNALLKIFLFSVTFLSLFSCSKESSKKEIPIAKDGVLDLRKWNFNEDGNIKLKGEWNFYWKQFLSKYEEGTGPLLVKFPSHWTSYYKKGKKLDHFGYGTYQLRILLPPGADLDLLGIKIGTSDNNVIELDINSKMILKTGIIQKQSSKNNFTSMRRFFLLPLRNKLNSNKDNNILIRIRASNFTSDKPGVFIAPTLGRHSSLEFANLLELFYIAIVIGIILMLFFHELLGFLLDRKNIPSLFLSITCFGIILIETNAKTDFIRIFFPESFHIFLLLGYLIAPTAYPFFIKNIISSKIRYRNWLKFAAITAGLGPMLALVFDLFFTHFNRIYIPLTGLGNIVSSIIIFALCFVNWNEKKNYPSLFIFLLSLAYILGVINDLLFILRIIPTRIITGELFVAVIIFQSFLLASRNSRTHKRVSLLASQLESLNSSLEKKVAARTKELREKNNSMSVILSNIHQGLVAIDKNLEIRSEYSLYTENILEEFDLKKQSIIKKFINRINASENDKNRIESALLCVVGGRPFEFELNKNHFPSRIELKRKNSNEKKSLELSWQPVIQADTIENIVLTFKDVTELEKLKLETNFKEKETQKIIDIIESGLGSFQKNIKSIKSYLLNAKKVILRCSGKKGSIEDVKEVFRNLHTIKGNTRSLRMKELVDCTHEVEKVYHKFMHSSRDKWNWNQDNLLADLDKLIIIVDSYISVYNNRLLGHQNVDFKEDEYIVYRKLSNYIEDSIKDKVNSLRHLNKAKKLILLQNYYSLKSILRSLILEVQKDAKNLGKAPPTIEWGEYNIMIPREKATVLNDIFGHLIRNSLAHGLESIVERRKKGLDESGLLKFSVNYYDTGMEITYSDDGKGLNLSSLMNSHPLRDKASDEELADTIFNSGVSTADIVSDLSGMGVGMDAVRSFLRKEGGDIKIEFVSQRTQDFRKIKFEISLPYIIPKDVLDERLDPI